MGFTVCLCAAELRSKIRIFFYVHFRKPRMQGFFIQTTKLPIRLCGMFLTSRLIFSTSSWYPVLVNPSDSRWIVSLFVIIWGVFSNFKLSGTSILPISPGMPKQKDVQEERGPPWGVCVGGGGGGEGVPVPLLPVIFKHFSLILKSKS